MNQGYSEADTLLHARWIIPVEPHGQVFERHSIAIQEGKILDILPSIDAQRLYKVPKTCRYDSHVIIPGLINAHTHAAMTLFRGLSDDLPLMQWLNEHIWPAEQRWVCEEFVQDGVRHAIAEMIRGGITCFNDMYFFPDETAGIASDVGMRAAVGLIVIDFPTRWANGADEYLYKGEKVHDRFRHDPLIHTALAPHAPYTVSDEALKRVKALADKLEVPVHMHVHETSGEVHDAVKNTGERPLKRLERLGFLSSRLQAVHMTQLDEDELATLGRSRVHIMHCPESNLKLGNGFCPVQALHEAGVNVAIGTDGAASNNDLDMFSEMRTAALLAKAVSGDPSAIPAPSALRMATLNGARALGIDSITGSLVAGKSADITVVDLSSVESQPLYDPVSQLVYATGRDKVSDVWVAGKQLLNNRQLLTIDADNVLERSGLWRDKLAVFAHQN
jgi:5-methylthioadenosine/S-adenosylhomocysteine deaminase